MNSACDNPVCCVCYPLGLAQAIEDEGYEALVRKRREESRVRQHGRASNRWHVFTARPHPGPSTWRGFLAERHRNAPCVICHLPRRAVTHRERLR